jgi:hypothetical protein
MNESIEPSELQQAFYARQIQKSTKKARISNAGDLPCLPYLIQGKAPHLLFGVDCFTLLIEGHEDGEGENVKRWCLALTLCLLSGLAVAGAQENQTAGSRPAASGGPTMHYALVGRSGGIEVTIDLDKFVIDWFEKHMATFNQMSQADKDQIARRLLVDESLDYVDVRLVNGGTRTVSMNVAGDTLTVSFKKVRAKYTPDAEDTDYPTEVSQDSQAEVRIPIATTTDAKMGIGRLAASLSGIDYLLRKDLEREHAADFSQTSPDPTERPEIRMAPIARSILEQDLSGEFFLSEEGITVPLVFRISTTDVDSPASH